MAVTPDAISHALDPHPSGDQRGRLFRAEATQPYISYASLTSDSRAQM